MQVEALSPEEGVHSGWTSMSTFRDDTLEYRLSVDYLAVVCWPPVFSCKRSISFAPGATSAGISSFWVPSLRWDRLSPLKPMKYRRKDSPPTASL